MINKMKQEKKCSAEEIAKFKEKLSEMLKRKQEEVQLQNEDKLELESKVNMINQMEKEK